MPIPQPYSNESQQAFMQRCMADPLMNSEFGDESQRYAVCSAQLKHAHAHVHTKTYSPRNWQTMDRHRGQFRKKYIRELGNAMGEMVQPFMSQLQESGADSVMGEMDSLFKPEKIKDKYVQMYREIGSYFAKLEFKKTKSQVGIIEVKSPITGLKVKQSEEEEVLEDVWAASFASYVENKLGQNITSVNDNTKQLFQKYLQEVLAENPGMGSASQAMQMHDKLNEKFTRDRRWRLKRIVRTETTTASNQGSITGMDSTGYDYVKTWLAAFVNTRDDHANAHLQKRKKGEDFSVGMDYMEMPGDPSASAGNVINCMCTHSFELQR